MISERETQAQRRGNELAYQGTGCEVVRVQIVWEGPVGWKIRRGSGL